MVKWGLFQEHKVGLTYKNQTLKFTILTTGKKNHVIMSLDTDKTFGQINIYL